VTFLLFQAASFLSAFLLFAIQPAIAKALLPAFGGTTVVWGTCVVTFQGLLFAGYLLSHGILQRMHARRYGWIHLGLFLLALACFRPFGLIEADAGSVPIFEIVRILAIHVGLPFLLLSFSTPLLQQWLTTLPIAERSNPYRLFSASNLGSILALLAYPFLIEPRLTLMQQSRVWWIGLGVLALLLGLLQWRSGSLSMAASPVRRHRRAMQGREFCAVFVLSAGGTALLKKDDKREEIERKRNEPKKRRG